MNKKLSKEIPTAKSYILETPIADPSFKRRCDRTVFRNKYEQNDLEIRSWWKDLFKILEEDAVIPPEEQYAVLESMYGMTLLGKILKICKTRKRQFKEQKVQQNVEDDLLDLRRNVLRHQDKYSLNTSEQMEFSGKSLIDAEDIIQVQRELDEMTQRGTFERAFVKQDVPKSQMYQNFFKRKPKRAAIWRTLPPLSMDEMNLNQKADATTEQIAKDFIDWLRDLGGDEELSLSVQSIIQMFEIGFHANSAEALKINLKEMPSVPKRVAMTMNLPNKAKRTFLHNEIQKDVRASKKKIMYTAFGRHLPDDIKVRPPAEKYYRKWMSCERVPENLASMATVWQGITHLRSTRAYCKFLIERPEITPPQYLVQCGMMDPKKLQQRNSDASDYSDLTLSR